MQTFNEAEKSGITNNTDNAEVIEAEAVKVVESVKPSKALKAKPAEKPPKPLTAREKQFTLNILKGMNITESYLNAGYKCNRDTASANGSTLLATTKIQKELARLQKTNELNTLNDFITPFKARFTKAIETLDALTESGNDYVKLSAVKEVLDRVAPKVTRNESIKYSVNAKELQRRKALLME